MKISKELADELAFANSLARVFPDDAYARWTSCRSGHTFQAFFDKQIVVYELVCGVPKILKVLSCESLNVNLRRGTSSTWVDRDADIELCIGHVPVEVAPNCFMWHLRATTLNLHEYRGSHSVKFNIAYRTQLNPSTQQEGSAYILEYAAFRKQYANV
jgi:hypothetical protein